MAAKRDPIKCIVRLVAPLGGACFQHLWGWHGAVAFIVGGLAGVVWSEAQR